jgi:hypothetical protein
MKEKESAAREKVGAQGRRRRRTMKVSFHGPEK